MYNKLFTKILDSSIWLESMPTRLVWLTFIAAMDEAGFVQFASVPNVALRARVPTAAAEKAIACLEGPDPNSADPDHEGRRIEKVPGGWMVLNAGKYRDLIKRAIMQEQTRARVAKHRAIKRGNVDVTGESVTGGNSNAPVTPSEVFELELLEEKISSEPSQTTDSEPLVMAFTVVGTGPKSWSLTQDRLDAWTDAYPGVDVYAECKKARAWLDANPTKRKTAKGMAKFLNGWMARSVDSGKAAKVSSLPRPQPVYASDWYEECGRLHGHACGGQSKHGYRMSVER